MGNTALIVGFPAAQLNPETLKAVKEVEYTYQALWTNAHLYHVDNLRYVLKEEPELLIEHDPIAHHQLEEILRHMEAAGAQYFQII